MNRQQKQAYWFGHVRAWRDSGLSQADYCAHHGLSLSSFGYWRQHRREHGESGVSPPPRVQLIPVRIVPAQQDRPVVLRGPGNWSLEVPVGTPADWLANLLRGLT